MQEWVRGPTLLPAVSGQLDPEWQGVAYVAQLVLEGRR